ncbi:hypothetical protein CSW64_06370 [Caulobacter mirabilis]|uniref:Uncharacterized protein n=2 Tax=Caulobacter mirabilis TaxID=69666 RepID=A0A2D2AVT0_9CAUL|nr:hypothetical protein CSW64_06370 [Caulobacter mirabilis]
MLVLFPCSALAAEAPKPVLSFEDDGDGLVLVIANPSDAPLPIGGTRYAPVGKLRIQIADPEGVPYTSLMAGEGGWWNTGDLISSDTRLPKPFLTLSPGRTVRISQTPEILASGYRPDRAPAKGLCRYRLQGEVFPWGVSWPPIAVESDWRTMDCARLFGAEPMV